MNIEDEVERFSVLNTRELSLISECRRLRAELSTAIVENFRLRAGNEEYLEIVRKTTVYNAKLIAALNKPEFQYEDVSYKDPITPEVRYAPFNCKTFELSGAWIKPIKTKNGYLGTWVIDRWLEDTSHTSHGDWVSWEELFHSYIFLDGTPCGTLE